MGNIPSVSSGQLATADQYNALQSAANSLTETSYTSWKLIQTLSSSVTNTTDGWIPFIDETNGILYLNPGAADQPGIAAFDIATGALISFTEGAGTYLSYGNNPNVSPPSIRGVYMPGVNWISSTEINIEVLSKGKLLWRDSTKYTLAGAYYMNGPFMSATGRYLVFFTYTLSPTATFYVYEGQP